MPEAKPPPREDRGALIFAIGATSVVLSCFCIPLGPVAWVMGSKDMKAIDAGEIDPKGRGLTQAGYVLGIAGTVLFALNVLSSVPLLFWQPSFADFF